MRTLNITCIQIIRNCRMCYGCNLAEITTLHNGNGRKSLSQDRNDIVTSKTFTDDDVFVFVDLDL